MRVKIKNLNSENAIRQYDATSFLRDSMLDVFRKVLMFIKNEVKQNPNYALEVLEVKGKKTLKIDLLADTFYRQLAHESWQQPSNFDGKNLSHHFGELEIYSEETLFTPELNSSTPKTYLLYDPLDGSDLVEFGFSPWAAAATLVRVDGETSTILGAFIGSLIDTIYISTPEELENPFSIMYSVDSESVHIAEFDLPHRAVAGSKKTKELKDAVIATYGQKIDNFLAYNRYAPHLGTYLKSKKLEFGSINNRLTTLGGLPIVTLMLDHVGLKGTVHLLNELVGQSPWDAAPGLILALRSGELTTINLNTPNRRAFNEVELADAILNPETTKLRYIIASTPELAANMSHFVHDVDDNRTTRILN